MINWHAHGRILRKSLKQRSHLLKLVHGTLPTNHVLHRGNPARKGCPCCNNRDETWSHIVHCPHTTRAQWRYDLLRDLVTLCRKWKTRPELGKILIDGIQGWLQSDDPMTYQELEDAIYDDEFYRLISYQQNQIGWDQCMLERFSAEWETLQDNYHYTTRPEYHLKKSRTAAKWQVAII